MLELVQRFLLPFYESSSTASLLLGLVILSGVIFSLALFTYLIVSRIVATAVRKGLLMVQPIWAESLIKYRVVTRLSRVSPAITCYLGAALFVDESFQYGESIAHGVRVLSLIYMLGATLLALDGFLNAIHDIYSRYEISKKTPIKTYIQVIKLIVFGLGIIFAISILLNKSPWGFFTGLGAMMAIISLVFKDSILGFVASIQLAGYDMVRLGDWITVPSSGVDGDVIEISLSTVKIKNFDKTITTIPTPTLLTSGVTNWRGMQEAGGRRIKRAILIDIHSIKFCDPKLLQKLSHIKCLARHVRDSQVAIEQANRSQGFDETGPIINGRQLSNIGMFRAYIIEYLKANKNIHKNPNFTFLVRQLAPTPTGLPLELYVFTNNTNWVAYEGIQSDIFDHLLAALSFFELKAFQNISGNAISVYSGDHLGAKLPNIESGIGLDK